MAPCDYVYPCRVLDVGCGMGGVGPGWPACVRASAYTRNSEPYSPNRALGFMSLHALLGPPPKFGPLFAPQLNHDLVLELSGASHGLRSLGVFQGPKAASACAVAGSARRDRRMDQGIGWERKRGCFWSSWSPMALGLYGFCLWSKDKAGYV